jgi:hypothetical protein
VKVKSAKKWVLVKKYPNFSERRIICGYLLMMIMGNDIVDRMQAEEALREAMQAAQSSNARGESVGAYISLMRLNFSGG